MGFVRRQAITAALTANAIRPLPGFRTGIPAFFAGWLTGELAPHVLGLTVADAAGHLGARRRSVPGLALAGASALGLGYLIRQSRRAVDVAEEALVEGLGVDYVEELDAKPTPADLATPWRSLANPFAFGRAARRAGVEVHRDIPFTSYGRRGVLDVYTSEVTPAAGAPVLLQVHGGGWAIGNKDQQGLPLMQHMAARGWVCVAINYRLAPRDPWPAQIVDVKAAIAWIREHIAEYGGSPDYIAITGGSAGGHLTALAAVTPNAPDFQPGFESADTSVQAAVPYYGVYDLAGASGLRTAEQMRDHFLAPIVFKRSPRKEREIFEQASPLLRVTADAPDFFVIHGSRDTLVDPGQARAFVAVLRATSKRSVTYAELPGAQHAFDIFPSIRSQHLVRATDRFLHWHWNRWRRERAGSPESTISTGPEQALVGEVEGT